jgi:hypothetical protein
MQKLEQRIALLEAKQPSSENEVTFIYIAAMGQDDETIAGSSTQTGKGYKRWVRAEGESIVDFRSRIETDCLGVYAPKECIIKTYLLFHQYPNGAHYELRPKHEYDSWGAYTNKGSDNTIHKVGGLQPDS